MIHKIVEETVLNEADLIDFIWRINIGIYVFELQKLLAEYEKGTPNLPEKNECFERLFLISLNPIWSIKAQTEIKRNTVLNQFEWITDKTKL